MKVQVSLKLPPDLVAQVDLYAKNDRRSRSAAIELLLERGLAALQAQVDAKKAPKGQKAAG